MTWKTLLNGDPLPWLLEPDNPSVRYWTLTGVLDLPQDAAQVREARAAIPQQPLVQELFASQHPDGHWGNDETKPYTARGAVGVLGVLHALGVARDLLSALHALAVHGYAQDPRFAPLLNLFLARQDDEGRWLCGSASRTWPLEKRNRPSKWVTLDALRLLKTLSQQR